MFSISQKPHVVMWGGAVVIMLLGIFRMNVGLDIQMHDTYIVTNYLHIGIILALLLGILGLGYWMVRKTPLIRWMTSGHVIVTLLTFLLFMTGILGVSYESYEYSYLVKIGSISVLLSVLTVIFQPIYLFNLIVSTLRN